MLVLTRKLGESLLIGDAEIMIVKIKGNQVRVGVKADRSTKITRKELLDKDDKKGNK